MLPPPPDKSGMKLGYKIIAVFSLVFLFTVAMDVVRVLRTDYQDMMDALVKRAGITAEKLGYRAMVWVTGFEMGKLASAINADKDADENIDYITIVDNQGRCLATTENEISHTEFDADAMAVSEKEIRKHPLRDNIFEVTMPVFSSGKKLCVVRLGITDQPAKDAIYIHLKKNLLRTAAIYLTGILLCFLLIRFYINRPIEKLTHASKELASGNYTYRADVQSRDELGDLAKAFNHMGEAIFCARENLEDQVKERTKALSQAKETLEISEKQFRGISASAQDAIIVMDNHGKITFWNKAAENTFGWSENEIMGRDLHTIIVPERYYGDFSRGFEKFRSTGQGPVVGKINEVTAIRKDGTAFPVEVSLSAMQIDGQWNAVGLIRDITARKQAEEEIESSRRQLIEANDELEQAIAKTNRLVVQAECANMAKSEFLANMSHEIRTPMNGVLGFAEMLLDSDLDEEQLDQVKTIKRSGDALLSLINDILDFSKIDAGQMDFEEIDFDPELVAYDVCELVRPRIGSKPIEILCRIGDNVPSLVKGDPLRFRQVLMNLMGNSPKFTEAGEIELSLAIEEEEETRVKLHAAIRDTGIGIPKDKLGTIFEAFKQADGTTTRKYGGTGLGLSICKKISEMMKGRVWAESPAGSELRVPGCGLENGESETRDEESGVAGPGSIFHFTAWFAKADGKQAIRFTPASLSGKKALIVDDNPTNLDILTYVLESVGMSAVALTEGKEVVPALKKALEAGKPFDVCISDIQMPDMNGYETAQEIRRYEGQPATRNSQPVTRGFPLIALSSSTKRDSRVCEKAGFDGFLNKPIRKEKLYKMMEKLMSSELSVVSEESKARAPIATQYSVREDMKHSVRILLAEDNIINQKLAKMMLTKAGYHVEVANNGREALEKYTQSPDDFDLIFMDVQMPEMDGLEATRQIREWESHNPQPATRNSQPVTRHSPIVAMTANAMKGDREKCLKAGMDDYVSKPIKREVVFEVLERQILGKGGR